MTKTDRSLPKGPASEGASASDQDPAGLAIALENVTAEALAGEPENGAAARPKVVASGRGAVAEQILQIAFERGVKVRKDSDLAEILAAVEVESEIPLAALAGVAEILRYLYQTDRPGAAAATDCTPAPPEEEHRS